MAPLLLLRSSPLLRANPLLTLNSLSAPMPRHPSSSSRGRGGQTGGGGGRAQPPPPPARPPKHKRFFSTTRPRRQEGPKGPSFMTFNVDGLQKASSGSAGEPFWALLARLKPTYLMIQEHKIPRDTLDDPRFALHGYTRSYWDRCEGNKRQWGVVTFVREEGEEPVNVLRGEDEGMPSSLAGRMVVLEFEEYVIFNSYAPYAGHSTEGIKNLDRKLGYLKDLEHVMRHVDKQKPVIWAGDMNVRLDALSDPLPDIPFQISTGNYTTEELSALSLILNPTTQQGARKMADAFAHLHPFTDKVANSEQAWKRFTRRDGWDGQNVLKGQGSRLDTFIVSNRLLARVQSVRIEHGIYVSDHYPVLMTLKAPPPPTK